MQNFISENIKNIGVIEISFPKGYPSEFLGFFNNSAITILEIKKLPKKEKTTMLLELDALYSLGFLTTYEIPKKGDKCYFWNSFGEMLKGSKDNSPYIDTFVNLDEECFCTKSFRFRFCCPVKEK